MRAPHDRIVRTASCIVLTLQISLSPAAEGSKPGSAVNAGKPAPLVERVTSELVLIEAYVSDNHGGPVEGLAPEDFVLRVDGKVAPISTLEYRQLVPPALEATPAAPAPATPSPGVPAVTWPRRFILFFEDGTSGYQGLTVARRAADQFLGASLAPSDQVALTAYDRGLRVLHDFTTDREAVRQTIATSLNDARRVSDFPAEEEAHDEEVGRASPELAAALAVNRASEEVSRLSKVLRALTSLVDSLSSWRGFKAIVYMGDGVSENPADRFFDMIWDKSHKIDLMSGSKKVSLSSEVKALSLAASAAGVTFYAVQTGGLVADRRKGDTLKTLALNTGGLFSSSNDLLRGLREAAESSRAYYILGYVPEGPPDGNYHSVELRCQRSGVRLRWRHGFTRLRPAEAYERTIEAAHLLPELYSELSIDLSAVAGPSDASSRAVDLVLHLPEDRVEALPEAGRQTVHLEVGLVAVDESGTETFRTARALRIGLEPGLASQPGSGINLFYRVRLPTRSQSVTAIISDRTAGIVGARRLSIPEAPATASEVLGLSIYSLAEKSLWIEVPASNPKGQETERAVTYTVGPALKTTFAPGEPLVCGFRLARPAGDAAEPYRLEIRRGETVLRSIEVTAGASTEPVNVPLPSEGLAVGDYVLTIGRVLPEGSGARASIPFVLR